MSDLNKHVDLCCSKWVPSGEGAWAGSDLQAATLVWLHEQLTYCLCNPSAAPLQLPGRPWHPLAGVLALWLPHLGSMDEHLDRRRQMCCTGTDAPVPSSPVKAKEMCCAGGQVLVVPDMAAVLLQLLQQQQGQAPNQAVQQPQPHSLIAGWPPAFAGAAAMQPMVGPEAATIGPPGDQACLKPISELSPL